MYNDSKTVTTAALGSCDLSIRMQRVIQYHIIPDAWFTALITLT